MKSPITVFHFTQPTKERIAEYSKRISMHEAVICFDFEDILMELATYSYSGYEREKLRSAIAETLIKLFSQTENPKAGVRLNSVSSICFEQDLRTLRLIRKKVLLDSVFLPKTESPDEILEAIEALHDYGICFREIIPVIETKRGMENINSLLSLKNEEFGKVAFGHCDYNRGNNYFPFFHQDTEKYWEWVRQIMSCAGYYNKMFINSPYLRLNDLSGFSKMLRRLQGIPANEIGQITLAERQTKLCAEFRNYQAAVEDSFTLPAENKGGSEDNLKRAVEIIVEFENNKLQDKSISVNREKVLISPHEYAAAIEYMNIDAMKYEIAK
ncbi:MAG: aldolase/citrate lyase family protein [Syntrophomonadaceae bacterium]